MESYGDKSYSHGKQRYMALLWALNFGLILRTIATYIILLCSVSDTHAQTPCGGDGQRGCCALGGDPGKPVGCSTGNYEINGCQGDCRCAWGLGSANTRCKAATPCGGPGQRGCCALGGDPGKGVGCQAGNYEEAGCHGDCRCAWGNGSSNTTCRRATPCGGAGQRGCCALGGDPGKAVGCNVGNHEVDGCQGDCRCAWGLGSSNTVCRANTPCGGPGQRGCCAFGGDPGKPVGCGVGNYEAGGCQGDCRCSAGAGSSNSMCKAATHCGLDGERACCVSGLGVLSTDDITFGSCDYRKNLIEVPGCAGDCRCAGSTVSSSGTCRPAPVVPPTPTKTPHFEDPHAVACCGLLVVPPWSLETYGCSSASQMVYQAKLLDASSPAEADKLCKSGVYVASPGGGAPRKPSTCNGEFAGWAVDDSRCSDKSMGNSGSTSSCKLDPSACSGLVLPNTTFHDQVAWLIDDKPPGAFFNLGHILASNQLVVAKLPVADGHPFRVQLINLQQVADWNRDHPANKYNAESSVATRGPDGEVISSALDNPSFFGNTYGELLSCGDSAAVYNPNDIGGPTRELQKVPKVARRIGSCNVSGDGAVYPLFGFLVMMCLVLHPRRRGAGHGRAPRLDRSSRRQ